MKAFVLVTTRTGEIRAVVRNLASVEGVIEAHMTFGPHDAIAIIEADDINHLGRLISNHIQPIPGILQTLTLLAVD